MHERLKTFFRQLVSEPEEVDDGTTVPMAATMLLLEVAWADHEITPDELEQIRRAVVKLFALPDPVLDDLVEQARKDHAQETSLYPFIRVLNESLDPEEKRELLTELWRLAYADAMVDKYQEHRIRYLAELLYVPHRAFINAKLTARESRQG